MKEQSKILELEREYYIALYETKNPDPIKIEVYIEATNIENKLSMWMKVMLQKEN